MRLAGGGCWLLQAGRRVRRAAVRACQRRGCCVRAAGGASTERGDKHDPSDDGVRASHLTAGELAALRRLPPGQASAARRTPSPSTPTATSVIDGQPPRAPVGSNRRGLYTPRTRCGEDCCARAVARDSRYDRLNYDQNVSWTSIEEGYIPLSNRRYYNQNVVARDGQGAYVRRRQNYGTYAAGLDSDCNRVKVLSRQYHHICPTGWDDDDGYRVRISDRSTVLQQNSGRVGYAMTC
uniref:Uncharacterized protein n=1 Tax=Aegilops tauschii subsp. strangulata TaxID=200361 RepID=A0A453GQ46_AEGTS